MITRSRVLALFLLASIPLATLWLSSTSAQTKIRATQIYLSDTFAFTGAITSASTTGLNGGGNLSGTFTGNPAFSGNPTFSGTPVFSSSPTITSGLAVAQGGSGQTVASTFPSAAIAIPGALGCGTTTTCSNTALGNTARLIFGSVALSSGSPSTATITGISPAFTSSSSYFCQAQEATTAANDLLKVTNVSSSSFTITGPNTVTDTVNYFCIGN